MGVSKLSCMVIFRVFNFCPIVRRVSPTFDQENAPRPLDLESLKSLQENKTKFSVDLTVDCQATGTVDFDLNHREKP